MCEEFCGEKMDVSSDSLEDTSDVADVPDEIPEDIDEDISEDKTEGIDDIPEDISTNTELEETPDEVAEDEEFSEEVSEDIEQAEADEVQEAAEEDLQEDGSDEPLKEGNNQESVTGEMETWEDTETTETEESYENDELPEEDAESSEDTSDVADVPDEIPEDIDEDVSEDETGAMDDILEDIPSNAEPEETETTEAEESPENNESTEEEAEFLEDASDVAEVPDEIPEDINEDVSEDETEAMDDISLNAESGESPEEMSESISKERKELGADADRSNDANWNPFKPKKGSKSNSKLNAEEWETSPLIQDAPPRNDFDSKEYSSMVDALIKANVEYRPIQLAEQGRTEQDIIKNLSGGDMTKGSCSSLAFAYAGNKAGYEVLDFRDGDSRSFFSSRRCVQTVADMPGINSKVLQGKNDIETTNQLLSELQDGKEYYLATGGHAAIVRRNAGNYQYLELQHPTNGNGWHALEENILRSRFGCRESRDYNCSSFLMEVDSMANSFEFRNILGFINTSENNQRKGVRGDVR